MWRSLWFWLALVIAVLCGAAASAFRTTTEVEVSTAPVTDGRISRHILATGTVQAVTTVEVGAQVSGIIASLGADYNSLVHTGQVIATLDASSYDAQLREALAGRTEAEAALKRADADVSGFKTAVEDAQMKLTRAEVLWDTQLIPRADLDAARVALDEANADLASGEAGVVQAVAAVAQARAAVDQASVNAAHTIIRSPVDGIVIERTVDVGQTLASSIQSPVLFRIAADLDHLRVQVDVDEADVGGLTPGEPVTFDVDAYPGEKFNGTISQVRVQPVAQQTATATVVGAAATSPATSTVATVVSYTTIVEVANLDERLRPGMTADVVLPGARREHAVRIPNSALAFRPPPEVLEAIGENEPLTAAPRDGDPGNDGAARAVWEYDGRRFTPIAVRAGVADEGWTELVSGSVRPGDALVTSAVLQHRHRL
jgi:HlyD family secretion protein